MAPANPVALATPPGGQSNLNSASRPPQERRRRPRSSVHWPVILFRNREGEEIVESVTRDLSSGGFYCLSPKPFKVGELLRCSLHVPIDYPTGGESLLECRVQVVRVEENVVGGQYGIACRTQDYRLAVARSR